VTFLRAVRGGSNAQVAGRGTTAVAALARYFNGCLSQLHECFDVRRRRVSGAKHTLEEGNRSLLQRIHNTYRMIFLYFVHYYFYLLNSYLALPFQ
jgi:hypothetical protein